MKLHNIFNMLDLRDASCRQLTPTISKSVNVDNKKIKKKQTLGEITLLD